MPATGNANTKLIVLRGNSGSGKSTTARTLRECAGRGVALVEQDYLRRVVLRERGRGEVNVGLIAQTVRYALDHRYHVILEGILQASLYAGMLADLDRDHRGSTAFYYFDISLEGTIRRHATRRLAAEVGTAQLREWYVERDLLDFTTERVVPESATLEETVARIGTDTELLTTTTTESR